MNEKDKDLDDSIIYCKFIYAKKTKGSYLMGTRIHQKHPIQRDASCLQLPCIGNGPWAIHVQTFLLVWFVFKVLKYHENFANYLYSCNSSYIGPRNISLSRM
jgi:hypothetical protein